MKRFANNGPLQPGKPKARLKRGNSDIDFLDARSPMPVRKISLTFVNVGILRSIKRVRMAYCCPSPSMYTHSSLP